jgi:hypothetical protein
MVYEKSKTGKIKLVHSDMGLYLSLKICCKLCHATCAVVKVTLKIQDIIISSKSDQLLPLWSSAHSSWLQMHRSRFDSRH